ncbi:Kinase [Caenorhabditis elegans]|uniref:Kinase n=1 Tax=Caenorhabditis elegans TaxID=6239 RepID=Q9BKX8_CAEEL|nr:Kinase [Caenorhabditis elegans]CCD73761.1 Kinase [Caenorhabditis elegans]|eukprot:NP_497443.1 Kinase [Caenorhabditis elegans]
MVLNIKRASSLDGATINVQDVLKPFDHQVGGHTPFTSLPNGHLLKPCEEREILFYQKMPKILKSIAPLCCSTIQGSSVSTLDDSCSNCRHHQLENVVIPESIEGSPILNKRKLSKNFIVLSDLTYRMKSPRILDLKLGTRQHGDQATVSKIACMTAKCQATTSATLGIRLCGMKIPFLEQNSQNFAPNFAPNSAAPNFAPKSEISINKYMGRSMDKTDLFLAVKQFFDVPEAVLEEVERRLLGIRDVLCGADGVRLFGASLLIVIESNFSDSQLPIDNLVRIKVVDFANATFGGLQGDSFYDGRDDGSILGLETLLEIVKGKN